MSQFSAFKTFCFRILTMFLKLIAFGMNVPTKIILIDCAKSSIASGNVDAILEIFCGN